MPPDTSQIGSSIHSDNLTEVVAALTYCKSLASIIVRLWSVHLERPAGNVASAYSAEHSDGERGEFAPGPSNRPRKTSELMRLEVWRTTL
jgi:hypothetical protein